MISVIIVTSSFFIPPISFVDTPGASVGFIPSKSKLKWIPFVSSEAISKAFFIACSIPYVFI